MGNCVSHCGYAWWAVILAAVVGCLGTYAAMLLDRWAEDHWADPIEEAADSVPIQSAEDAASWKEWAFAKEDRNGAPEKQDWVPDAETVAAARAAIETQRRFDVEADDKALAMTEIAPAWWWVNDRTLHVVTCPQVARAQQLQRESPDKSKLAPVPTYDENVVAAWAERQVLHLCGTCDPLPGRSTSDVHATT